MDPAKNFGFVTVSIGYDASAISIALSTDDGAKLPNPVVDGSFNLVWYDSTNYPNPADDPNVEICRVTGRSTDTLTITRAAESTTASTKNTASATYKMFLGVTAKTITDISLIKLDDFGTPDDNTDLDFGVLRHGLTPKGTNIGNYLKDDGTWASPSGSGDMTKAVYDTNDNSRVDTSETLYDVGGNKTYTQISSEIDGDITTHAALPNAHHNESHTVASHSDTTVTGPELDADHTKLATIDTSANNYTHPNHTGEVTSTGDGATVIADDAVTNAKLANVSTDTIKGRTTGGAGDPEDLTAAQTRTILNVQDGATDDQTGAEIKVLYEAEADTNAYTDAEKTKLGTVDTSANAYVHPNHSGDVTSSGDGATAIAAGVIVNADVSSNAAIDASKMADGTVSNTEFQYINSLSSNAQNQITARVTKALFDANTILKADSNDTPAAMTIGEQTILGRITAGQIAALTAAQVRTMLNVADGADVSPVSSVFGRTGAVDASSNDYTWAQVDKTTSDIADITTKSHTSLSDIGSNAHSVIDTHLGAANPHSGSAASGVNSDITQLSGLATDLSIAQGGTGQSTAQAAIDALSDVAGATNEHVLTKDTGTGNATFKAAASGFTDPMTTRGDIIIKDASNNTARLGVGSNTQVLKSDGTDISWGAAGGAPVDSVFGRTGVVDASSNDYTWAQVDKTTSDIADITTKSHTSLTDIGTTTHADLDTDHTKLATVDTSANAYTHPNHTGDVTSTGDGATAIAAGVIVNADVSSNAAIEMTKVAVSVIGSPTYDDAQDFMNLKSSGIITGGTMTDSGSGEIDIAAGTGIIKIADSVMSETKSFNWDASLNFALTDGKVNYIYVDYNGGSPIIAATDDRTTIETYRQFTLGRVFRNADALHIINSGAQITNHDRGTHERLVMRGIQWGEGAVVSFTNKQLSSTEGKLYLGNNQLTVSTTLITDNITQWYHTASVWDSSLNTDIDNTYYDNGSNLTELGNSKFGVHWIYVCGCDGDLKSVYGRGSYSLAEAENASVPSNIPDCVDKLAILAAKVIIQKGASAITSIASAYETTFPVSSPVNHNDLGELQGGASDDYYHLTNAHHTDLTDGNACTSHKHAATQIADGTVTDAEFQYINSLSSNAQNQITARVTKALFDANTILKADSNDTPAALTVAEQTIVGRITAGVITALTAAQVRTLINVADGADVTGSNAPQTHAMATHTDDGALATKSTVGTAEIDNNAVTYAKIQNVVADERILGNVTAADSVVEELTKAQVLTMLNVADGADVTGSNAPQAHHDLHDPADGSDALDCAAAAEIASVQAAAEGTAHEFARSDHVHAINHGIADNHIVTVDSADAATGEYAKFTANGLESKSIAEVLSDISVTSGADVTGDNAPQAHDLDSHNSCTLAQLSTDISDATLASTAGAETLSTKKYQLNDAPGSDHTAEGMIINDTVGENVVFGDLLYIKNDGKWWKSDADATTTMPGIAMAIATITADADGELLLSGTARDDSWTWSFGGSSGIIYASCTPGEMTQTAPSGTGDQVQVTANAIAATIIIFNPSSVLVEIA